jgi:hypothetical protein
MKEFQCPEGDRYMGYEKNSRGSQRLGNRTIFSNICRSGDDYCNICYSNTWSRIRKEWELSKD